MTRESTCWPTDCGSSSACAILSQPLHPHALHVGGAEGGMQGHVGEELEHGIERVGQRGHRGARGVGVGRRGIARGQVFEAAGDGSRVALLRAFVEEVQRQRGEPRLARGIGVLAGPDGERDGDERHLVALDEEDGEAVAQRELLRDWRVELHRGRWRRWVGSEGLVRACPARRRASVRVCVWVCVCVSRFPAGFGVEAQAASSATARSFFICRLLRAMAALREGR